MKNYLVNPQGNMVIDQTKCKCNKKSFEVLCGFYLFVVNNVSCSIAYIFVFTGKANLKNGILLFKRLIPFLNWF